MQLLLEVAKTGDSLSSRTLKGTAKHLPKDYVAPLIEGMYAINAEHPEGIIYGYVSHCDWEHSLENA
jgi:hypothetical protein